MAVGDTERIVESLVSRGLVAPSMVGRTVGQATIEELKNLGSAVGTSQATRQNEQSQRLAEFQKRLIESGAYNSRGGRSKPANTIGSIKDITKPFAVGQTKGNGQGLEKSLALAIPTSKGIQLKSFIGGDPTQNALAKMALQNSGRISPELLPTINTQYISGSNVGSLQDLINTIAGQSKDPQILKQLFGGI